MAMAGVTIKLRTDATPEQLIKDLILSPLIYLRLLGILFSIIVFGCISDQVIVGLPDGVSICAYNRSNACNFGIAIGVIAFLLCLAFLVKDVLMVLLDFSNALNVKKVIIVVDMVVFAFWGFMWFVTFCFTADQRRRTGTISDASTRNCANAGIAFSFFSVILWVAIVVVNGIFFWRLLKGLDRDSEGGVGGGNRAAGGYASFPEGGQTSGEGEEKPYTPPEY